MTEETAMQERQGTEVDLEQTVLDIMSKREPNKAVEELLRDNFKYRDRQRVQGDQIKDLETQLAAAKEVPDNTEELAKLAKWQELGDLDTVKANLSRLIEIEHDNSIRAIADAAEMNFNVLKDLDRLNPDIVLSLQDGKPVVKRGEDVQPLDDFAKTEWSQYEPSLRQTPGTTYIQQTSSKSGSKGTDYATAFIQGKQAKRESDPNPLKR